MLLFPKGVGLEGGLHRLLDLGVERGVGLEQILRGIATLGDVVPLVAHPGTTLLDDVLLERKIQQGAGGGDPLIVHDVELSLGEGRSDLVLNHLHAGAVAGDGTVGLLDRADASDIATDAGVELESLTARGGLGIAEHDADLLTDLVGEDAAAVSLGNEGGELPHGGAHEAGLGTDD